MKVLVVDDEPTLRKMMGVTLKRSGFDVVEAGSGREALAAAEKEQFDFLVTDVVMDQIDGLTLAQSLVERQPGLGVLFVSGYPLDFEKERSRFPRCGFLAKPFPPADLVNAVMDLQVAA